MFDEIHPKRCPAILRGLDIGSCLGKWTAEYLSKHVGNKPVKIHVSETGQMNFLTQNFQYKTLPFDQIIKRSSVNEHLRVAFEGVQLWTHYDVMDNLFDYYELGFTYSLCVSLFFTAHIRNERERLLKRLRD